jgi:NhaP-type Na+/H+ or K+/H+ antiporter
MLALIKRIEAHVRFVPMIFGLVLVYAGSKFMHLAPLVTVMAVGLILNNIALLRQVPALAPLLPMKLDADLTAFKHLTAELTFVVRTFFFVLLGYSTRLADLAHPHGWAIAAAFLAIVFVSRAAILRVAVGRPVRPLLWFAPRGLITVLLYLTTPASLRVADFPEGALMLTVLGSIVLMAAGILVDGDGRHEPSEPTEDQPHRL